MCVINWITSNNTVCILQALMILQYIQKLFSVIYTKRDFLVSYLVSHLTPYMYNHLGSKVTTGF